MSQKRHRNPGPSSTTTVAQFRHRGIAKESISDSGGILVISPEPIGCSLRNAQPHMACGEGCHRTGARGAEG